MKKAVVWQMKAICSRKAPIGMFLFLYAYVLLNYLTNVFRKRQNARLLLKNLLVYT